MNVYRSPAEQDDFANVAEHLPRMARERPHALAIVMPTRAGGKRRYVNTTFAQLEERSNAMAAGLREIGIVKGTRTVLMVRPSLPFFALTFALFKVGAVPVMVDPGMGVKNLGACLGRARPEAFIGIPQAHEARVLLGWARSTVKINVMVGSRWLAMLFGPRMHTLDSVERRGVNARAELERVKRDDVAAILFTSGSTGIAKGAVYRHGNFLAQVDAIKSMYAIEPGEIDLPTFPLFALFDPALGMTTVVPDMDFSKPASVDGANIAEAIADWQVTNMFASPAVLDRVARWSEGRGVHFASLRRVISAGAPVHPRILERFRKLLPDEARIHTPYGATESLPIASVDDRTILGRGSDSLVDAQSGTRRGTDEGKGICVGKPVPSADVEIIRISDDPILRIDDDLRVGRGVIGEITVAGPQVTTHYFDDERSTALHKIDDGGRVRHRVGDVGYFDDQGRLWFCGRKSHRVEWKGETLFTEAVEGPFNAHPHVLRTALVKGRRSGRERLVLYVEPIDDEVWRREAAPVGRYGEPASPLQHAMKRIADRMGLSALVIEVRRTLPVDPRHNAKILREQLARDAGAR
jgi:acyl-CoA synthetase (AMP-forming)/AMP-acid ligase II